MSTRNKSTINGDFYGHFINWSQWSFFFIKLKLWKGHCITKNSFSERVFHNDFLYRDLSISEKNVYNFSILRSMGELSINFKVL